MTNNQATTDKAKLPVFTMPALADDTPSRHPCKIRIPSAQKRYMFDPYKAQVTLGLESEESTDESEDSNDGVDDSAFDAVTAPAETPLSLTQPSQPQQQQPTTAAAPCPVEPYSPLTIGAGSSIAPAASNNSNSNSIVLATSVSHPLIIQEAHRRVPTPTPVAPTPHDHTTSGLSSFPLSVHHPTPSFQNQQDGLPTSLNGIVVYRNNNAQQPFSAPAATGGSLCEDEEDDRNDSQDEGQQVGGAHYTNEDGCFRMHAGSMHHALVRFKFSEDVYVVPLCDRRGLCVGDLVVVEGDRGENIGQVAADVSDQHDQDDMSQKQIIRRALNKDRKKYYHARRKDALASKAAQQIVQDFHLRMHVLDAEFQSDLMKLTIYFRSLGTSGEAIDFREIQRGLFKQFRCRIWLLNWDEDRNLQRLVSKQLLSLPGKQQSNMTNAVTDPPQEPQTAMEESGRGAFFVKAEASVPQMRGATPPPAAPAMFQMHIPPTHQHLHNSIAKNSNDGYAMYPPPRAAAPLPARQSQFQQHQHDFQPYQEQPHSMAPTDPHIRYNNNHNNFHQMQQRQQPSYHNVSHHSGGQQQNFPQQPSAQQPSFFAPRR